MSTANAVPGHAPAAPGATPARSRPSGLVGGIARDMSTHHVTLVAAGVAFYGFVALVPSLIAGVSLYGLVADPSQVTRVVGRLSSALPPQMSGFVDAQLHAVASSTSTGLGIAAAIGLVAALWSASSGMVHLLEGLNLVNDVVDDRPMWRRRGVALGLTFGAIVVLVAIGAVVTASTRLGTGGLGRVAEVAAWAIAGMVSVASLVVLYQRGRGAATPGWRQVAPGAGLAAVMWVAVTIGLRVYVANVNSFATYGSLGAIIVTLLWMELTALATLVGAEVNVARRRAAATRDPASP